MLIVCSLLKTDGQEMDELENGQSICTLDSSDDAVRTPVFKIKGNKLQDLQDFPVISESLTVFFCSRQQMYTAQVLQDSEEVASQDSHSSLLNVQHSRANLEDG